MRRAAPAGPQRKRRSRRSRLATRRHGPRESRRPPPSFWRPQTNQRQRGAAALAAASSQQPTRLQSVSDHRPEGTRQAQRRLGKAKRSRARSANGGEALPSSCPRFFCHHITTDADRVNEPAHAAATTTRNLSSGVAAQGIAKTLKATRIGGCMMEAPNAPPASHDISDIGWRTHRCTAANSPRITPNETNGFRNGRSDVSASRAHRIQYWRRRPWRRQAASIRPGMRQPLGARPQGVGADTGAR